MTLLEVVTDIEAVEQTSSVKRTNSGRNAEVLAMKIAFAEELELAFNQQISKLMLGKKLQTLPISYICEKFGIQQGYAHNMLHGYYVIITRSGRSPNHIYHVSVRWITDFKEAKELRAKIDSSLVKGERRMIGGLGLSRSFEWLGKTYSVRSETQYTRTSPKSKVGKEEVSKMDYCLDITNFWYSGARNLVSK